MKKNSESELTFFKNPELWAKSTLPPPYDIEKLKRIYTFTDKNDKEKSRERIWLHDVLDDNNIPYVIEIVGYWVGKRDFREKQRIYVEKKHKDKALKFIDEYNNAEVSWEDFEDISDDVDDTGNAIDNEEIKKNKLLTLRFWIKIIMLLIALGIFIGRILRKL